MGVLTGLWLLSFLRDRAQWRTVMSYGVGCLVIACLIFPYNAYLTGDPLLTPINVYLDELWGPGANALGFGPDIGAPDWGNVDVFDGHSPLEAVINAQQSLYQLNLELFGWAGFSLIFALVFVLWGRWSRFAAAMAVIVVGTACLYALYWYAGGFYTGPRYWFLMLVPLLIFTALGIGTSIDLLTRLYPSQMVAQRLGVGVATLCFCALLVFESWLAFNKYPEINGYHDDYGTLAKQPQFKNSLIFIASDQENEFGSAIWLNDFGAGANGPIFAMDMGAESNREIASFYGDRQVYFVAGRSKDQTGVSVTRGPLTAGDL